MLSICYVIVTLCSPVGHQKTRPRPAECWHAGQRTGLCSCLLLIAMIMLRLLQCDYVAGHNNLSMFGAQTYFDDDVVKVTVPHCRQLGHLS